MSALHNSTPRTPRLDEIATRWSLFQQAHQGSPDHSSAARNAFVLQYGSAVRKYVGAIVKDSQEAEELAQEVMVRLLRGDFAGATPARGRFRDLLKVAVRNMVRSHWSRKQRRSTAVLNEEQLCDSGCNRRSCKETLFGSWRQGVLDRAMAALDEHERAHAGCVQATLLRLRMEFPEADSEELAARLAEKTGKAIRTDCLRQQLHRARERFAQLLVDEVAQSMVHPTAQQIEDELREAGLLQHVSDYLPENWRQAFAAASRAVGDRSVRS
jgi:RNA polymerase sigma-70 factor (ECF subfamily)